MSERQDLITIIAAGAGYVLSHFADHCADRFAPGKIVFVRRSSYPKTWPDNVQTVCADASDRDAISRVFSACQPPIVLIDSVPPARDGSVEANAILSKAASKFRAQRAIYLSSTSVYDGRDGAWVDESSPTQPSSAKGQARLRAEDCYRACGVPSAVLRLSGIYGPGRGYAERLLRGAIETDDFDRYTNRIHVEDIVAVLQRIIYNSPPLGDFEIINVSDDEPALKSEVIDSYAKALSIPRKIDKLHSPNSFQQNQRVSNKKLKQLLSPFSLRFPSFKSDPLNSASLSQLYQEK